MAHLLPPPPLSAAPAPVTRDPTAPDTRAQAAHLHCRAALRTHHLAGPDPLPAAPHTYACMRTNDTHYSPRHAVFEPPTFPVCAPCCWPQRHAWLPGPGGGPRSLHLNAARGMTHVRVRVRGPRPAAPCAPVAMVGRRGLNRVCGLLCMCAFESPLAAGELAPACMQACKHRQQACCGGKYIYVQVAGSRPYLGCPTPVPLRRRARWHSGGGSAGLRLARAQRTCRRSACRAAVAAVRCTP